MIGLPPWIFEKSVQEIYNLIRGCDPQPGAYTTLKGKKVRLYDARMDLATVDKTTVERSFPSMNGDTNRC